MKIIHTADWHLGKKIEGRSMLCQQRCALDELCEAAFSERPDALIIAGDVFDTAVPSSEAEELFSMRACAFPNIAGRWWR